MLLILAYYPRKIHIFSKQIITVSVPFSKIADFKFIAPRRNYFPVSSILPVTDEEHDRFFRQLSSEPALPVILSIVPGYAKKFEPLTELLAVPQPLSVLFRQDMVGRPRMDIIEESEKIFSSLSLSMEEAEGYRISNKMTK